MAVFSISHFRANKQWIVAGSLMLAAPAILFSGAFIRQLLFSSPAAPPPPAHTPRAQYIVVLKNSPAREHTLASLEARFDLVPVHTYRYALGGFSASLSDVQREQIARDPSVAFVSKDRLISISATPDQPAQITPSGIKRIRGQKNIQHRGGGGIGIAVLDTGIDRQHPDLAENIAADATCIPGTETGADDNGHGTHVAGIIAGRDNDIGIIGVAPDAYIIAIKVLDADGDGMLSDILCGLDFVVQNAEKYALKIVNMSIGGPGTSDANCGMTTSDPLHYAICAVRDAGLVIIVAAGNAGMDATSFIPAAYHDAVITVSAFADSDGRPGAVGPRLPIAADDAFPYFSNYGTAVALAAPGVSIYSTWKNGGYKTLTGTSSAAAHVSGAVARYLARHKNASWVEIRDAFRSDSASLPSEDTVVSKRHPEPLLRIRE